MCFCCFVNTLTHPNFIPLHTHFSLFVCFLKKIDTVFVHFAVINSHLHSCVVFRWVLNVHLRFDIANICLYYSGRASQSVKCVTSPGPVEHEHFFYITVMLRKSNNIGNKGCIQLEIMIFNAPPCNRA